MPRKRNAKRPNAHTAGATIRLARPSVLSPYAMLIRISIDSPSQNALKFPATSPDRILSDAPPSREEVTTSRTWVDSVEVNTFTSSGITAPARVPQVITLDSFHQSDE